MSPDRHMSQIHLILSYLIAVKIRIYLEGVGNEQLGLKFTPEKQKFVLFVNKNYLIEPHCLIIYKHVRHNGIQIPLVLTQLST